MEAGAREVDRVLAGPTAEIEEGAGGCCGEKPEQERLFAPDSLRPRDQAPVLKPRVLVGGLA
jgi:hypothetical protein